jgi:hypothetical protein
MENKDISTMCQDIRRYVSYETQKILRRDSQVSKLFEVELILTAINKESFWKYLNEQSTIMYNWVIEGIWKYIKEVRKISFISPSDLFIKKLDDDDEDDLDV